MGVQQCGNASSSQCAQGYAHVILCLRLNDFWKMHSVPQEKGINPQLVCDDHLLQSGALLGLLVHFFFIRHTKLHQFQVSRGSSQAWK